MIETSGKAKRVGKPSGYLQIEEDLNQASDPRELDSA